MQTPNFKGKKVFKRLDWAKVNLKKVHSKYAVVYEEGVDDCARILSPDPNWLACALQGGILPPVWVYWMLAEDEAQPDFKEHTRKHLLDEVAPIGPLTEEKAIEYLIYKDVPRKVWENWNKGNKPKLVICRKDQIPKNREWRDAWKIAEDVKSDQALSLEEQHILDVGSMLNDLVYKKEGVVYA